MNKFFFKIHLDVLSLVIVLFFSILIIMPFIKAGYFPTHDGEWAPVRLAEMFREVKDGQIPPRYSTVLNNGYGYPLFNFAYPFPYYIGLFFKLAGLGFVDSIKLVFALSVIVSGIGMYFFARYLWNFRFAGLVSSFLYLFLPYRMVDLYVRGSIGESVTFAIIPLLFLSMLFVHKSLKFRFLFVGLGAFLLSSLILSHNIMAVYFIPIVIVFSFALCTKKNRWYLISLLALGIGGSMFFFLPALVEKQYILLSKVPIADRSLYFASLSQLIIPRWGYGVPTDVTDPFAYQLGIAQIVALIVCIGIGIKIIICKKLASIENRVITGSMGLVLVMVLFMFSPSSFLWKNIPILSEINYPWTLLAPIGFLISISAGYIAIKNKSQKIVCVILILIAVIQVFPYARPSKYVNRGEGLYSTNTASTTSSLEYTPLWVKTFPKSSPNEYIVVDSNSGKVTNTRKSSNKITADLLLTKSSLITINTIYYPGWNVFIDNQKKEINYENKYGVMQVKAAANSKNITAVFQETKLRLWSDIISGVSFVGMFAIIIFGIFKGIIYKKYK